MPVVKHACDCYIINSIIEKLDFFRLENWFLYKTILKSLLIIKWPGRKIKKNYTKTFTNANHRSIDLLSSFSFLKYNMANVKTEPTASVMPNVFQVTGYK